MSRFASRFAHPATTEQSWPASRNYEADDVGKSALHEISRFIPNNCARLTLPRRSVQKHSKDHVTYHLYIMQLSLPQASLSSSLTSGTKSLHIVKHARQRHIALAEPVLKRKLLVPQAKKGADSAVQDKPTKGTGLGDLLGPIGLSLGKSHDKQVTATSLDDS